MKVHMVSGLDRWHQEDVAAPLFEREVGVQKACSSSMMP